MYAKYYRLGVRFIIYDKDIIKMKGWGILFINLNGVATSNNTNYVIDSIFKEFILIIFHKIGKIKIIFLK